jgi:hypothetical protein
MRLRLVLAALALAGLVAGCSSTSSDDTRPAGQGGQPIAAQQQTTAAPLAGYSVTVPALALTNAPLAPLALNPDHSIQVPPLSQPRELGVYDNGPRPGATGPAVILGHIDANGVDGAFKHLDSLKVGDEIDTTDSDGKTTKFTVYRADTVPKASFPTSSVYSDVPTPELRLITCGGALDTTQHNYLSNVIVWARKA